MLINTIVFLIRSLIMFTIITVYNVAIMFIIMQITPITIVFIIEGTPRYSKKTFDKFWGDPHCKWVISQFFE